MNISQNRLENVNIYKTWCNVHFCSRIQPHNLDLFFSFYPFYLQAFTSSNKLMLLLWKYPEETETHIFCSIHQSLFLNILYITGAVRQTGGTKRIFEPLQKSTVKIYVHRLFSYSSSKNSFSEWLFLHRHTKIQHCAIYAKQHI